jgi:drug/metabolite transporter (DMT)-like permease
LQKKLKNGKAHAAVIAANLLFGINFSAVQYITKGHIGPFGLNVIRVSVTAALFWLIALFSGEPLGIRRIHISRFLICAITGIVINQSFFIKGVSLTMSTHASLLILVTPVFISVAAALVGSEPMTRFKVAGLTSAICGAVLLALHRSGESGGSSILLGDVLIIINAISYALYFVYVKALIKRYGPMAVIRWIFTFGLLFTLPIGWVQFSAIQWQHFTPTDFGATAFIVIGATFLTYLFTTYSIHRLGASVTGAYIYTQPVFATLIAILFLHEEFTLYKAISALLIVGGVLLVEKKERT